MPQAAPMDFNALLDEAPRFDGVVHDAAEPVGAPQLDLIPVRAGDNPILERRRRIHGLLMQAIARIEAEDTVKGAQIAFDALSLDPDYAASNQVLALALDRMGRLSRALEFYERAWKLDPHQPDIYHNLGLVAWKLKMLDAAETFYRLVLKLAPARLDSTINLAGILRDTGRFADAIELLRTAIMGDEDKPGLWNALGTVILESGDPVTARTFYEEALRLDGGYARAWHNLAYALSTSGEERDALTAYDNALANHVGSEDAARMRHGRALTLLALGDLDEAWNAHECRLDPAFEGATLFQMKAPYWDGTTSLEGQRVLVVGEQGLGDEVMFLNTLRDVIAEAGPTGAVHVACERRLVSLVRRSFPEVTVGVHATVEREGRDYRGVTWLEAGEYDVWTAFATPCRRYRAARSDFAGSGGYLKADPTRVATMKAVLASLPEGLKVGVCWKSMVMTAKRAKYFAPFEAWRAILQTPGMTFVSMQYGQIDEEVAQAAEEFGVTIHPIDGVDLKDDLEGVAALGQALDVFIGPMNASTNLAAAVGGNVWFVANTTHWPLLGGSELPWYPGTRAFSPETFGEWQPVMTQVAEALSARVTDEPSR